MMHNFDKLLRTIQERMDSHRNNYEKTAEFFYALQSNEDLLPEALGEVLQYERVSLWTSAWSASFTFPWNEKLWDRLIQQFEDIGWTPLTSVPENLPDQRFDRFLMLTYDIDRSIHFSISLRMEMEREGGDCHLKQVGVRQVTVEKPIFEKVCAEGANEPWGISVNSTYESESEDLIRSLEDNVDADTI
jgi:hypothetical protein